LLHQKTKVIPLLYLSDNEAVDIRSYFIDFLSHFYATRVGIYRQTAKRSKGKTEKIMQSTVNT
jgi:hypothetical protein